MENIQLFGFGLVVILIGIIAALTSKYIHSKEFDILYRKLTIPGIIKYAIIIISIAFVVDVLRQQQYSMNGKWHFILDNGTIPTYLAFFATAFTGVVIYQTFKGQSEANERAEFENRLFKFIDYHRENVNELKYRKPKEEKNEYFEGNQVFTVIYYEIIELLEEYFNGKYNCETSEQIQALPLEEQINSINFIYQCVFFGAGKHSFKVLEKSFSEENFKFINFKDREAAYMYDGKKHKFYSGHVRRLGHYFRNLYQAISYVDRQHFLNENDKYEYVTMLRAQMSVYEQAVFFFNSVSDLGGIWELKEYQQNFPVGRTRRKAVFKQLWITKYDLVRNTLNNDGFISDGIEIQKFYPLVNLERRNEYEQNKPLPFIDNVGNNEKHICRLCFNERYIGYENDNDVKESLIRHYETVENLNKHFRCDEPDCFTKEAFEI